MPSGGSLTPGGGVPSQSNAGGTPVRTNVPTVSFTWLALMSSSRVKGAAKIPDHLQCDFFLVLQAGMGAPPLRPGN